MCSCQQQLKVIDDLSLLYIKYGVYIISLTAFEEDIDAVAQLENKLKSQQSEDECKHNLFLN